MANDLISSDGEVLPETEHGGRMIDVAASVSLARAEIDMQVATARAYPRSVARVMKRITELATLDEETAQECCYALVRRKKGQRAQDEENKPIEGPSVRLAELAAQAWGNARIDARVISVNRQEKYVEAEGVFHDLETNMATRSVVRRRISTTAGFLFSDDMIVVTGNAACAIAKRNAILSGIPRGIYRPGYAAARGVIAGTIQTLGENRAKVYKAFAAYGVTPVQIHELLSVGGEADVGLDHIALLRATFASLKSGEVTVAEVFAKDRVEGVKDALGTPETSTAPADAEKPASTAPVKTETPAADPPATRQRKAPAAAKAADTPPADQAAAGAETAQGGVTTDADAARISAGQPHGDAGERESAPFEGETSAPAAKEPEPATKKADASAPKIKTEAEYRDHVLNYIEEAGNATELLEQWKGEKQIRRDVNITPELVSELKTAVEAKVTALKGA